MSFTKTQTFYCNLWHCDLHYCCCPSDRTPHALGERVRYNQLQHSFNISVGEARGSAVQLGGQVEYCYGRTCTKSKNPDQCATVSQHYVKRKVQ